MLYQAWVTWASRLITTTTCGICLLATCEPQFEPVPGLENALSFTFCKSMDVRPRPRCQRSRRSRKVREAVCFNTEHAARCATALGVQFHLNLYNETRRIRTAARWLRVRGLIDETIELNVKCNWMGILVVNLAYIVQTIGMSVYACTW